MQRNIITVSFSTNSTIILARHQVTHIRKKMGNQVPHKTYSSKYHDGYRYSVTFEDEPFASGASRHAFKGRIESDGPRNGQVVVTKVFKKDYAQRFDHWAPDVTASKKAQEFAQKFNDHAKRAGIHAQEVSFKIPMLLKVDDVKHFNLLWVFPIGRDERFVKSGDYVAVEDFIPGAYVKFNNNAGFEDPSLSEFLLAFCHWTYEISNGKFMICDLQGVKTDKGYYLTDPAVHSLEEIYGETDHGVGGMIMVLKEHRCNRICQKLGLKNPLDGCSDARECIRSTFYSFQLPEEKRLRLIRDFGPRMYSTS